MAKNDNAHSIGMTESLRKNVGEKAAEGIFRSVFRKSIQINGRTYRCLL